MIRRCPALIISWLLLMSSIGAQTRPMSQLDSRTVSSPNQSRPRIGLVLSGGGARGWAHVGVLKWLEEHRIPVDYVAGTSMGGLVGAMYAMGARPNEIREVGNEMDWDKALSGPPSFDELSYRRKEDQRAYPTDVEFGAGKGIKLPSGINSGHNIALIFDKLTLPYASIRNFDDLPIPFRCVATDMIEARQVVLSDMPLSQALRATMSIPGLFNPVEINDRVLADGGLLNNIPTDVAKEMGADIIIAVNVGTPLGTREEIRTLPGMLSQIIGVATIESDRRNLKLANLVITPDLGKYTLLDFTAVNPIADLGYKAAELNGAALEKYSLSEDEWKEHIAARDARRRSGVPVPNTLAVEGTTEQNARSVSKSLTPDLGNPIDPDELGTKLSRIRGQGRYESLDYTLSGAYDRSRLMIHVRDKAYGPALLLPIVALRSSNIADVKFSIGGRFTIFDIGEYGSELRFDAIIGSDDLLGIEYFRPLGQKGLFVAPRALFEANSVDLFSDGDRVAEYRQRKVAAGVDFGYIFNRRTEVRVGYEVGRAQAKVSIGDPVLPSVRGLISDASASFSFEGQNSANVPTRGLSFNANAHWYFAAPGSEGGFPQAQIRAANHMPLNEKSSLFLYGGAGTTFSDTAAPLQQFTLGGPFRLGAFGPQEFRGDNFVLAGAGYQHRVGYLPEFLGRKIYAAGWYEIGGTSFSGSDFDLRNSVSGGLLLETRIGPLVMGGAFGEGGRGRIFISLGRIF